MEVSRSISNNRSDVHVDDEVIVPNPNDFVVPVDDTPAAWAAAQEEPLEETEAPVKDDSLAERDEETLAAQPMMVRE